MPSSSRKPTRAATARATPSKAAKHAQQPATAQIQALRQQSGTLVQMQHPVLTNPAQETANIQKTSISSEQSVTQTQSTEIVQTFLYASVSSILSMRDLLPPEHFDRMYYAAINKHCSYQDFTSGAQECRPKLGERRPPGYWMYVLKRGASKQGDLIVERLETGVFDAMIRGYLDELQLSILEDPNQPTKILELYSFNFRYTSASVDSCDNPHIDVDMTDPSGTTVTLGNARLALNTVVRTMVDLNGSLPHLPSRRFVLLHLMYNDRRPRGYQAEGFGPSATNTIRFPTDGWEMQASHCGQMSTGIQTVGLRVLYTSQVESMNDENAEAVVMPDDLIYGKPLSRLNATDIKANVPGTQHLQQTKDHNAPPSEQLQTESSHSGAPQSKEVHVITPVTNPGRQEVQQTSGLKPRLSGSEIEGTEAERRDQAEKQVLMNLLRNPVSSQALQDTQPLSYGHGSVEKLAFSQTVVSQLRKQRSSLLPPQRLESLICPLEESQVSARQALEVVCECGSGAQDDDMIFCCVCDKYQHLHCYGYHGCRDARIPDFYACYTCLLHSLDSMLIQQLIDLVSQRRAIYLLQKREYDDEKQLANALGYVITDTRRLLASLRKDHLLVPPPKRGSGTKRIVLDSSEEANACLRKKYFDPTSKIAHHLAVPESLSTPFQDSSHYSSFDPLPYQTQTLAETTAAAPLISRKRQRSGSLIAKEPDAKTPRGAVAKTAAEFSIANFYTPSAERYL